MEWEAGGRLAEALGVRAFPESSYLYGSPFHFQMTSHQALGVRAMACGTGILEKADGVGPEPARGGRFPQGTAGQVLRVLQMEEHCQ